MIVLVSDTSVLIDLERGGFLEAIFSLPYEFAVPDVLYHRELEGAWGERRSKRSSVSSPTKHTVSTR